jgi:hypothetical protein
MKKLLIGIITVLLIVFLAATTWGASIGQGARAIGMGGAYTAVADDGYAPYWNPAGIIQIKYFGLSVGVGAQGNVEKLKNINDAIDDDIMPSKEDLNQTAQVAGFFGITTKHFGINDYLDFELDTKMDDTTTHINATAVDYALATIAFHLTENLAFGINLKAVGAGYAEATSPNIPDTSKFTTQQEYIDAATKFTNGGGAWVSSNTGTGTACDVGFLYKLSSKTNIGFTARNVFYQINPDEGTQSHYTLQANTTDPDPNNWTLELHEDKSQSKNLTVEIPKSYILGLAYHPFKSTLISADLETITNSGNDQTRIHLGVEQSALWNTIAIRLGCFTNKDKPISYTAGIGLRLLWILNVNAAYIANDNDDNAAFVTGEIRF